MVTSPQSPEVHQSPFVQYREPMMLAALQIYQANLRQEPSHDIVPQIMPQSLGDMSPEAVRDAEHAQAQVTVGARVIARYAEYADTIDGGGAKGLLARLERAIAYTGDRRYVRRELGPNGLVQAIRSSRR